jgi:diguanylate cyclase (GGDEF)-like protein
MTNTPDHARRPGAVRASRSRIACTVLAALGSTAVVALAAIGYATGRGALLLGAVALTAALGVALYRLLARPAVEAMRLALTDPVTGLGNTRHFLERLERDLDRADEEGLPLTLCLLDIDDFKRVNDHFGHPSGDGVLVELAGFLRRGGEAFRLGGDEFALLLSGRSSGQALAVAEAVLERIASHAYPHGRAVTASAGIATYPDSGIARAELVRAADRALYEAKSLGKDCVRVYTPNTAPRLVGDNVQRDAASLLEAAQSLVRALATRGIEVSGRGEVVGDVAARIASRMELSAEQVELVRIAGALNDVGKLALPDDVLLKPGPLTEPERHAIERHPEIGYAMLESLGADPVATWIRHHHERWDGAGYPQRLSGERIPLGARILFVADAFEAMTSDQVWRRRLTVEAALAEIERCAGTQFDSEVVAALVAEYGGTGEPHLRLAG